MVRQEHAKEGERRQIVSVVDHTLPVTGESDPLFWDESNHRCLCVECHNWKTNAFDGGAGNTIKPTHGSGADAIQQRWQVIIEAFRSKG